MGHTSSLRVSQVGVLLAAVVLLGIFALSFHTVQSFRTASESVQHMQEGRVHLADAMGHLREMHLASRTYLTSGDARALEGYRRNIAEYHREIAALREKITAPRRAELAAFEAIVEQLLAEYEEYISLYRTDGPRAITARFATGNARRLAEEFRAKGTALQSAVAADLADPLKIVHGDTRFTLAVLGGGAALDIALVLGVVLMLRRDYRAREAAAAALRRHADEIQDLYNRAPCGYHSLDADGRFVAINDTELAWFGYSRDEVIGRMRMSDMLSAASRPALATALEAVKKGQDVRDLEVEVHTKAGRTFPACIHASAIRDEHGRFIATRSTLFDITERKRIERMTAQARVYAESIVDTVREPLVVLDRDLRVNSANRVFFRQFQFAPADTVGRAFHELAGGIWDIPALTDALRRVFEENSELSDFELDANIPALGEKVMLLNARALLLPARRRPCSCSRSRTSPNANPTSGGCVS